MSGDKVWIRATAEIGIAGVDEVEDFIAIPRAEWDAMTEQDRERELAQAAEGALEQLGAYFGADIVDESEVPAHIRSES